MPKVRVNDIEMYYVEAGAGDPLVLVMGFGGDHLAWGFQMPVFAAGHRVIAFDNRGAGQTDTPDVSYTIRMMADDTVGLMDRLGINRAHVLGVSMGGMIAQEIALNHPARVRTLQLHCTFASPDRYTQVRGDVWRVLRTKLTREETMRTVMLWLFESATYNDRPDFIETLIANGLANPYPQSLTGFERQLQAIAAHETLDRLGKITCPTLVSTGEHDALVSPHFSRELASHIPAAEFRTLPGGHVYFWEYPNQFNEMCLEFLAKHSRV
ncbi:MAG TPA: alpha/beta hydrolase [Methylomirabilota bacterium]|jgi:3-oxoadipate enol-lactonase|nr:alpha/beta hydrolase [Methylomirabilota bacterium]